MPTRSGTNYLAKVYYLYNVDIIDNIKKRRAMNNSNNTNQSNSSGDSKPNVNVSTSASTANNVSTSFKVTLGPSRGDKAIDYESSEGAKTYKRATAALKDEYDGSAEGSAVFKMQLYSRAKTEGWSSMTTSDILNIPIDPNDLAKGTANVIKEKSKLSDEAITKWANTHIIGQPIDRRAQNNENMIQCIQHSLSKDCLAEIDLKDDEYTINGTVIAALLYKTVMDNAELDTMVTSAMIRKNLQNLRAKMPNFTYSTMNSLTQLIQRKRQ